MAVRPLRGLALCAGGGGLELGLHLALGDAYRAVCHVERDAYAAATLVARMEDQALAPAPVWDDVGTFDGAAWRGAVDLVSGGFPCQPISSAGQRRGTDDERWLWPLFARIIRDVGPGLVFLENVPPLLRPWRRAGRWNRAPVEEVLGDLADLGFDAEWEVLSAADCGAPHLRRRVFILAYRHGTGLGEFWWEPRHDGQPWDDADGPGCALRSPGESGGSGGPHVADPGRLGGERRGVAGCVGSPTGGITGQTRERERGGDTAGDRLPALAHANGGRGSQRARRAHDEGRSIQPQDRGVGLADTSGAGRQGQGLHGQPTDGGADVADPEGLRPGEPPAHPPALGGAGPWTGVGGGGLWPPGPDEHAGWRDLLAHAPGLEPSVRRDADGLAGRLERLRTLGNGVVPIVAAAAFCRLARRAGLVRTMTEHHQAVVA